MNDYVCLNTRFTYVRFKFMNVRVAVVIGYAPCDDRSVDEKERFWNVLTNVIERIPRRNRVVVMGDVNCRVRSGPQNDVVGAFGVPCVNDNGRSLIEICNEWKLCVM